MIRPKSLTIAAVAFVALTATGTAAAADEPGGDPWICATPPGSSAICIHVGD